MKTKEKKQQDIKMKYINQSGIENFLDNELGDEQSSVVDTRQDFSNDRYHADNLAQETGRHQIAADINLSGLIVILTDEGNGNRLSPSGDLSQVDL